MSVHPQPPTSITPDFTGTKAVGSFFQSVLSLLEDWKPALGDLFADENRPPARRDVDAVAEPLADYLLGRCGYPLAGAGFVASHSVLSDAAWHMAWWQGSTKEQLLPSNMESVGETYSRREWFTVPVETGLSHVTGPYVDFLCTDEYTVTMTSPVVVQGRTVGVVGADVFVESLETVLLPALRQMHPGATLVNRAGRVIVSANPQLAAGRLLVSGWRQSATPVKTKTELRGTEFSGLRAAVHGCAHLPLAVVIPDERI
jgi:hypothetical protein